MSSFAIKSQPPMFTGQSPVNLSPTSQSQTVNRAGAEVMSRAAPLTVQQVRRMKSNEHNLFGSVLKIVSSGLNRIKDVGSFLFNKVTKRPTAVANTGAANNSTSVARQAAAVATSGETKAERALRDAGFNDKEASGKIGYSNRMYKSSNTRSASSFRQINSPISRNNSRSSKSTMSQAGANGVTQATRTPISRKVTGNGNIFKPGTNVTHSLPGSSIRGSGQGSGNMASGSKRVTSGVTKQSSNKTNLVGAS